VENVFLEPGSIQKLEEIIQENSYSKVLIVTNKNSFSHEEISGPLYQSIINCEFHRFFDYDLNPKGSDVIKGINDYNSFKPDIIIGIGGGSAMDMAKLIHYFAPLKPKNEHDILNLINDDKKSGAKRQDLVLIPTTSGSGSEATHFAVIYLEGKKYSLADESLLPSYTIVDSQLTQSLPARVSAFTGLDAYCQAIESYWAKAATDESRDFSIKAIKLIHSSLKEAVNSPSPKSRDAMAKGSYYAGKAINITKTTAPHALSYYLTTKYNIPHGHAVALCLPYFIELNAAEVKFEKILTITECKDLTQFKKIFIELIQTVGLESNIKNILKDDLQEFINSANPERLGNNPIELNSEMMFNLFSNN